MQDWAVFDPDAGIVSMTLQLIVIMAMCCILVTVPIDQFRDASRLDCPLVHLLCVLDFVALLQVGRLGPFFSLGAAACMELLSHWLLKRKAGQSDGHEEKKEDEKHG